MKSRAPLVISQDEATVIGATDTRYWLLLNDADAELLAAGRLPPDLQARCAVLLSWKRDQEEADTTAAAPLLAGDIA